ncbi:unnamed protein product [Callosobruchus maculatus]|uniref:Uncharacterized protein n=1 Tax=Callosobruchus maculatus TaxID=64391 RepID=A0A653DFJ8_CALMS|nr:unnamed protein product [Callosobruchus maculatus]
MSQFHLVYPVE